jgi:hypothetical protein
VAERPAFCPSCGAALSGEPAFCPRCGKPVTDVPRSQPSVPPPVPVVAAPAAPKPRGNGAIVAVVVVVVVVIVILAAYFALGGLRPAGSNSNGGGGGGGGSAPQAQTENLANTQSGTLGAGSSSADVIPFVVPAGSVSAEVLGWFNVTSCSGGGNCNAYVYVVTPTGWANFRSGGQVTVQWCYTTSTTCSPLQYTVIDATGLQGYAGTTLDLVFFNTDLVFSQTYTAYATLVYTT